MVLNKNYISEIIFCTFGFFCIAVYMGDWFNYFAIKENLKHINDLRMFIDARTIDLLEYMIQKSLEKVLKTDPQNVYSFCSKIWEEVFASICKEDLFINSTYKDLVVSLHIKLYYTVKSDVEREIIMKLIETYIDRCNFIEYTLKIRNIYP